MHILLQKVLRTMTQRRFLIRKILKLAFGTSLAAAEPPAQSTRMGKTIKLLPRPYERPLEAHLPVLIQPFSKIRKF